MILCLFVISFPRLSFLQFVPFALQEKIRNEHISILLRVQSHNSSFTLN